MPFIHVAYLFFESNVKHSFQVVFTSKHALMAELKDMLGCKHQHVEIPYTANTMIDEWQFACHCSSSSL